MLKFTLTYLMAFLSFATFPILATDFPTPESAVRTLQDKSQIYSSSGQVYDLDRRALLENLINYENDTIGRTSVVREILRLLGDQSTPFETRVLALKALAKSRSPRATDGLRELKESLSYLEYSHPTPGVYSGIEEDHLNDLMMLAIFKTDPNLGPKEIIDFLTQNLERLRSYKDENNVGDFILCLEPLLGVPRIIGFIDEEMQRLIADFEIATKSPVDELEIWGDLLTKMPDFTSAWGILERIHSKQPQLLHKTTRILGAKLFNCVDTIRKTLDPTSAPKGQ
jgi:hypothetical protein